jgi:hypothetical protein
VFCSRAWPSASFASGVGAAFICSSIESPVLKIRYLPRITPRRLPTGVKVCEMFSRSVAVRRGPSIEEYVFALVSRKLSPIATAKMLNRNIPYVASPLAGKNSAQPTM